MPKYTALLEDEDDIFGGTPKSKFWDIVNTANDDLVKEQIDVLLEKFAVMESLLLETHDEEKLSQVIEEYSFKNSSDVEQGKKSAYIHVTTEIISRLDS